MVCEKKTVFVEFKFDEMNDSIERIILNRWFITHVRWNKSELKNGDETQ